MAFDVKNVPMFPTKHKAVVLDQEQAYPCGCLVMVTGNVTGVDEDGVAFTYLSVPAWTFLPVSVKQINTSGTTVLAGNMVFVYGEN